MVSAKVLSAFLGLFALASAQLNHNGTIDYSVVGLLNETHTMGVSVDNVTYPLTPNKDASILYTGKAPIAQQGYSYVKITKENNATEIEPFQRAPVEDNTVYEFFNRSWNTYNLPQLPTVYNYPNSVHRIQSNLHLDDQIPTMHIVGNQTSFDYMHKTAATDNDLNIMTTLTYVSLNETKSFNDVRVSLAGRSSRWVTKLSYNIKLDKKDTLYDYRRVKLRALDTDPSYIREQMCYSILKSVGIPTSGFSYVRVFLNNNELGLFGMIDTFQNPWLANTFADGEEDYQNGPLYQGVYETRQSATQNLSSDFSYHDNLTSYEQGQYKIKVEPSEGKKQDYRSLMDFTKFVDTAPTNDTNAVETWKKQLDTEGFLRTMALEVLLGFSDGYLAMADNYYLYQNLEAGSQFVYIPSDMDLTFGSTMFTLDKMWSGNYSEYPGLDDRPLMTKIMQVPEFNKRYNDLLLNITNNLINPDTLKAHIDGLAKMLKEDVAWDQSVLRVGKNVLAELGGNSTNNTSAANSSATDLAGFGVPKNINITTVVDFSKRMNTTIPFETAINNSTGHPSLAGIKEWVQNISGNIRAFYNQTSQ